MNCTAVNFSDDEKILAAHICDLIFKCRNKYYAGFSAFLDERQIVVSEAVLKKEGFGNYLLYGGYDVAARKMLGVFPEFDTPDCAAFPIKTLEMRYRNNDKLSHRDFLGAIMACGVARNMVGDIVVNDGCTDVFVCESVGGMLCADIKKIGSVGVKIIENPNHEIIPALKFEEICGTVSSMRADCIAALAFRLSRGQVAELIKSGGFTLNCENVLSVSCELNVGDVFSARGFGKFILYSVNGITKKDRFRICLKKYL